jgi:hypothetical protein
MQFCCADSHFEFAIVVFVFLGSFTRAEMSGPWPNLLF